MSSLGDASTLIPVLATDSASFLAINLIYCRLLRYDGDLKVTGDLAERWEVLEGGKIFRFTLNPKGRWHDGKPVTADDVIFTVQTLLDPKTPTPYKSRYEKIRSLRKTGTYSLEVYYREPFAPALESWTELYLIPQHLLEGQEILLSPLNRKPVGCGPYRFERWEANKEIVLSRNPDYYREGPYIGRVRIRIIPDQSTMFLELKNRNLDQSGLTPQQFVFQTGSAEFNQHFAKYRYSDFVYTYLGFNLADPLFSDRRVRRALAHAVDHKAIISGVLFGLGTTATGPFHPETWYYNKEVSQPEYNPDLANRLLDQAGWRERDPSGIRVKNGQPFEFTVLTNQGNNQRRQVAEILAEGFRKIGVRMEIRILEWSTFLNEFIDKRKFQAVILGWSLGLDPDQYDIWHSSRTGPKEFNFVGYRNPEVDRLLEEGRRTFSQEERARIYKRIHSLIAEDQPYIFLYIPDSLVAVHRRAQGIVLKPAGISYNFEQWWIRPDMMGMHLTP